MIYPSEFDQIRDPELVQYRTELHEMIRNMTNEKLKQREDEAEKNLLECIHAPYLEIDPSLLDFSVANAVNSINLWTLEGQGSLKLTVDVHVSETDAPTRTYTLAVPLNQSPLNMVSDIIRQKLSGANRSQKQINDTVENYKDAYMLNVCGCDEVFYGAKSKVAAYKVRCPINELGLSSLYAHSLPLASLSTFKSVFPQARGRISIWSRPRRSSQSFPKTTPTDL